MHQRLVAVLLFLVALCANLSAQQKLGNYVVLAWNDLGMHCLSPTYDELVILPPYNNLVAQVVRRGNPPRIVAAGLKVEYSLDGNTDSAGKRQYGKFWANARALFGLDLARNKGLEGKGLAGAMDPQKDRFVAEGIPAVPVSDNGQWNPYQVASIVVRDEAGKVLARTKTTVPTSDELNCAKCHGQDAFRNILQAHDRNIGTGLAAATPVLCASCHGSPALGTSGPGAAGVYLSQAVHGFHADKGAQCYDCHPGTLTRCSRSARHTAPDGNCTSCHGGLADVARTIASGRIPWEKEPGCVPCHRGVPEVDTGEVLYRNAGGHGGLACASCHGSPHAMVPAIEVDSFRNQDNYQALQYQGFRGRAKSIGSCGACHERSRGRAEEPGEFAETHAGPSPEVSTACNLCHTAVPANTAGWPHGFRWKSR
jgi:hypothetical protein